ncbi:MAG: twin-arginine translocase subunit TatC [Terrimicrobiaceae bacterium]|nr:twin-arginine translocase subunit TatC [Terrimicrobiaceae bacterium]
MPLTDRLFKFREVHDEPKPFLDHIEDLRMMIIKMAIALGAAMVLSFLGRSYIFAVVQHPLAKVDASRLSNLQSLGVVDSFSISLELAFYAGLVLSFPFLLYFFAEFVLPALTENERRHLWPAAGIGFGLFLGGVAFAYFVVLPQTLDFFYHDAESLGWKPTWTVREYYSFTTQFVIAFGLAFELPVVVLLLVKMGVLNAASLKRLRPQAFVAVMVFAAVLTPTTDMVTMLLMGVPMYLLYELCIVVAVVMQRRDALPALPPG